MPGGAELGSSDPVHQMTLAGVLAEHRRSRPDIRSVVCGEVRFTYPELDDRTDRLARALVGAGVARGDRVVWLGQNCHRLIETWLAVAKIGAVVVPANWRQSATEMVILLADARPVVVIWQREEIGDTIEEATVPVGGNGTVGAARRDRRTGHLRRIPGRRGRPAPRRRGPGASPPPTRSCSSTPVRSAGPPTVRCSPTGRS